MISAFMTTIYLNLPFIRKGLAASIFCPIYKPGCTSNKLISNCPFLQVHKLDYASREFFIIHFGGVFWKGEGSFRTCEF
jgi:hypothetical protein